MGGPSLAENARTAVACARTGALTTYPHGTKPLLTNVQVQSQARYLTVASSTRCADSTPTPSG